jgi:Ca2+-binding RTX toxin-like protein
MEQHARSFLCARRHVQVVLCSRWATTLPATTSTTACAAVAADTSLGGLGNDTLAGEAGNDVLEGGPGAERLKGGAGADPFRFVTTADGPDTIVDFTSGTDKIVVMAANFGLVPGSPANLFVNAAPSSGAAAFLYNSATGIFAFDADGNGAGPALTLATLANKPATLLPGDVVLGS